MANVSVCMATYNGAEYIGDQLSSILKQLGEKDEVIISDDSSTDNTIAIVESFSDNRIKILRSQQFKNPIFNFENAIRASTGKYIFLADQDDIWLQDKVDIVLQHLEDGYDVVLSDCILIDKNKNVISESFFELNKSGKGLVRNLFRNSYIGCCLAFRRSFCDVILPFPVSIPMHDMWVGFAAETVGKVKFISDKLVLYRRHGKNESSTGEKSSNTILKRLVFRWNLIRYIPLLLTRKRNIRCS